MMVSESWSDDERREYDISLSEETCFIEQLPYEVIEIIFEHIPRRLHLELRVVCKRWCDILSQADQTLCFEGTVPHDKLENCTFRSIVGLIFQDVDINKIPRSVWEKIGFRVHSVILDFCKLGNHQSLKNLIVHCHNLQSLKIVFKENANDADIYCSPNMLKELNIIQRNLEPFEIFNKQQKTLNVTGEIRICEAIQVYPVSFSYTSGSDNVEENHSQDPILFKEKEEKHELKFLKELCKDDSDGMISSLTSSLSIEDSHRRQASHTSSTLRFIEVSVDFNNRVPTNYDEAILE